jgi:RimJ/RimL family protein N-acetyltransferase
MDISKGHRRQNWVLGRKTLLEPRILHRAARAVLRYGFSALGLIRIHASFLTRNPASGRVMQKLSMRHEGCRRQHVMKWGKCEDLELYGILKHEWEKAAEEH